MRILTFIIVAILQLSVPAAFAATWGYSETNGEQHWEQHGYKLCAIGKKQSPLNLQPKELASNPITFTYHEDATFKLKPKGYNTSAYAVDPAADILELSGVSYSLQSFHFHTPSEHELNGQHFVFEGHFIHQDKEGRFAVVGVFYKVGAANPEFEKFLAALPDGSATMDVSKFYPASKHYYAYTGSLTTPPCTEGLAWIVMNDPMEISAEQLATFKQKVTKFNSRKTQPLRGRTVTQTR